jgi:hypothetical protein
MTDTPDAVLNTDDPTQPGYLTAAEYAASYTEPGAEGPCHQYPPGLIQQVEAELDGTNG